MDFDKEKLSEKLLLYKLNDNKKAVKVKAYDILKVSKELITKTKEIYNFYLEPITKGITPLVIEIDLKQFKTDDEISQELYNQMFNTLAYKNFLQKVIEISKLVSNDKISITPILNKEELFYLVVCGNKKITIKKKKPILVILKELGIYEQNEKAIDLYLLNFNTEETDIILKKLIKKEELSDEEICTIINSIQDRIENEDDLSYYKIRAKCHQLVDKLYNHKILGTTHHCLLGRKKYIQIINAFSKEKYSKALSIRRVKEETDDPYILYNPQTMQYIYQSEFNDVPEKYKSYFNNIEDRLMRFWKTAQDNINKVNKSGIDICLVAYNLLTGTYIVNVFNKDTFTGEKFISKKNFINDINSLIKEFS